MCLDGNSANLSVRYLNAQLQALWENADECSRHAQWTDFRSTEYDKSRYTRTLKEFHYLTKRPAKGLSEEELFFSAQFGQPKLKFICNHEAVLFLTIETGHLNLAHKDASKPGARADKAKNRSIQNLELVFRTPFLRTNVHARDDKIGNLSTKHLIQMIVLQLDKARLIMYNPDESLDIDLKEALGFYTKQYLAFIQTSGNHVYFDLSDFDDNKHRPYIDYALIHNHETDYLIKHHSEEIKLLGTLDCDLLAKFYDMLWVTQSSLRNEQSWATLDICLATICSDWIIGSELKHNFFINFNKPIVEALCPHEVILKFHIKELGFFDGGNIGEQSWPRYQYFDWKLAFVVSVAKPGSHGLLQLDLDSARFSRHHSEFGTEVNEVIDIHVNYMISFFQGEYLDIISRMQLHIILGLPSVPEPPGYEYSEDYSGTSESEEFSFHRKRGKAGLWSERIRDTIIYGDFDQIIALSEDSINRVLRSRCNAVSIWEYGRFFNMQVQPLSVRLLTNNKAVVYVQAEGTIGARKKVPSSKWWVQWKWRLPTESDELEEFHFDTITLAYEVDLRLQSHDHRKQTETHSTETVEEIIKTTKTVTKYTEGGILERFTGGIIRRLIGSSSTETVETFEKISKKVDHVELTEEMFATQHLILDYNNARYVKELSDVTALGTGDDALERLSTVKVYLPQYLHTLVDFGHHILHTVPICKSLAVTRDSGIFAFTNVGFKVLTKHEVTIDTCLRESSGTSEMPLVVLYGVCGGQVLSPFTGTWMPGFVPVGPNAVGTLTLSSRILLERYLLLPLKLVNEATTIVPSAADVVDGVWLIELTSWAQHKTRSKSKVGCQWMRVDDQAVGHLKYQWRYRDEWSHEHEGNALDEANGEYSLSCSTENTLCIPTVYSPKSLDIKLEGISSVTLRGKNNHEKWFKKTSAKWSATIKMDTTPTGNLKVTLDYNTPDVRLEEEHARASEWCPLDIVAKHKDVMTAKVAEFEMRVLPLLRSAMEHTWQYTTMGIQSVSLRDPVFTRRGDLICELDLQKDAILPELFDKKEWGAHCHEIHVTTSEKRVVQADSSTGARKAVEYSNGNGSLNGYNVGGIAGTTTQVSSAVTGNNRGSGLQTHDSETIQKNSVDDNSDSENDHTHDDSD